MSVVSISQAGDQVYLRRYDFSRNRTHEGRYDPDGATVANIEFYRRWGAPQDQLAQPVAPRKCKATSSA